MDAPLVAVIACPRCGTALEGTWARAGDTGVNALHCCGSCAHTWSAPWPGLARRR
jgi:hypothetical protein